MITNSEMVKSLEVITTISPNYTSI